MRIKSLYIFDNYVKANEYSCNVADPCSSEPYSPSKCKSAGIINSS